MDFYFQNLSGNVILFYLILSVVISGLASLIIKVISKYIFRSEFNAKWLFKGFSIVLFMIFLYLILTDRPYPGGR